jgi:long-chain acyl-CoA synthetase
VAALITLDREVVQANGGPDDPQARRLVEETINEVNHGLSHPEQIKKWKILDATFAVGDELTPTMKVKRKRIAEKYGKEIDALYAEPKPA